MSDPYIIKNTPLNYNANDWFYLNSDKCILQSGGTYKDKSGANTTTDCSANKTSAIQLKDATNELDASRTQYNDSKLLYNRELLFTFNMIVGLALLFYYIYVNQSIFPSAANVVDGIKNVSAYSVAKK